jgi:hypothetical protein
MAKLPIDHCCWVVPGRFVAGGGSLEGEYQKALLNVAKWRYKINRMVQYSRCGNGARNDPGLGEGEQARSGNSPR